MSFNKWFPNRPLGPPRTLQNERRAVAMRAAWYVSTLMLVVGYVLMFVFWEA